MLDFETVVVLNFLAFSSFTVLSFPAGIRTALFHKYALL
jgi:hypothetical protein